MKAFPAPALLLALALARPGPAIASQASTTIGVSATVVAACTVPVSSPHAGEPITASCTPQTAVRIGQVGDGEGQPAAQDTWRHPANRATGP